MVGSVLVATTGSVHSTFQHLIIPQPHIHVPPRPLLFGAIKRLKILRLKLRLRLRVGELKFGGRVDVLEIELGSGIGIHARHPLLRPG